MQSADDPWPRLEALIVAHDVNGLALAVDELDDAQRRHVATGLRVYVKPRPDGTRPRYDQGPLLAIVGAAVLPDAKATGAWLSRYSLTYLAEGSAATSRHERKDVVPQLLFVLTRRQLGWLPDLVTDMARRLTKDARYYWTPGPFDLVDRLLEITSQQPPLHDGFVVGWTARHRRHEAIAALTADPRLAALVPRMFELDQVGAIFDGHSDWPATLADAVRLGLLERAVVLDACIARLGRPGKPGATRAYATVLEALEVTATEIRGRVDGFVAMLSASLSTVATYAQQTLFDLDDAGALTLDLVASTTRTALLRSEKKIVRAQLARLAGADPARAAPLAAAVIDTLPDLAPDLARVALTTLRKVSAGVPLEQRVALLERVGPLPRDLATELATVLGPGTAAPAAVVPQPESAPVAWQPRRLEPIIDLADLAAETARLLNWSITFDPVRFERVLESLIQWIGDDPGRLREALRTQTESEQFQRSSQLQGYGGDTITNGLAAIVAAAVGEPPTARASDARRYSRSASTIVVERMMALARAMRSAGPGFSLSRPTWDNGLISPEDLLARLTRAANAGIEPWRIELEQALLRLVTPTDPGARDALAGSLAALGTVAGRIASVWVSTDRPAEPDLRAVAVTRRYGPDVGKSIMMLVSASPTDGPDPTSVIWAVLTHLDASSGSYPHDYTGARDAVPWLAPRHRDLIAAHLLPGLAAALDGLNEITPLLPALAASDGGFGDASALALAYGLSCGRADARAHAVNATITLCVRQIFDAAVFARALTELIKHDTIVLTRLVAPLRTVADAGQAEPVWNVLRAVLPNVLAADPAPTGLASVLGLAAETAERVHAHDHVDGLADYAARRGTSRQLVEARRLQGLLTT